MKKILMVLMGVLLLCGVAYAKDYEVKKTTADYNVEVSIDKNPPVVGDNNIAIKLKDMQGNYVTDVKVVVEYSMPAMPGMPAMNYKTDAALDKDEYKAAMNLSMGGSWNILVKITKGEKTSKVKFSIDAQ
ncbi:MAG: FixH family protein [Thermodesulfovibrionia bacterium]|nr:FixH family protein [Thermodesulfovibrionia bacterium]